MHRPFVPNRTCGNCNAWTRHEPLKPTGVCRSNPPTVVGYGAVQGKLRVEPLLWYGWPATGDTDHCREWQERTPEDLPELDISRIAVDAIEGTA